MMTFLTSFIVFLGMLLFGTLAENYLNKGVICTDSKKMLKSLGRISTNGWTRIILPAVIVAAVNYIASKAVSMVWLECILLLVMIAVIIFYVTWFLREGDRFRELIMFLCLIAICLFIMSNIIGFLSLSIQSTFWKAFITIIQLIVFILGLGIPIVVCLSRQKESNFCRAAASILAILLLIGLLAGVICTIVSYSSSGSGKKSSDTKSGTGTTSEETADAQDNRYHFYNIDLQRDDDEDNDFNFGPNPYNKGWSAKDYDKDFRDRLSRDPALAAADIAWFDANAGTRLLGEFYDSCKGDWAKTINEAKTKWLKDPKRYDETLVAFFAHLDKSKIAIVTEGEDITDQMYMSAYTIDTVPDVIVMKTTQKDGPFLVYTIVIKGNTFTVKYRIPCGYQPTNVAKVMKITPQEKPATSSGGGAGTKPTPPETMTPEPTPPETTRYNKDPSQSNNSGKNDDSGPGKNTNTGGNYSSEQKPTNSNNYSSYDQYKNSIDNLKAANTTVPATTVAGATVDDNGSGGEADKPTAVTDKSVEISQDSSAQPWSGPDD